MTTLAADVMAQVTALMAAQGLSRSDLARRMGVDRAHVTHILNEPPSLTLRSISKLAAALGVTVRVQMLKTERQAATEADR